VVRPNVKRLHGRGETRFPHRIVAASHPASDTAAGAVLGGQTTPEASEALEVIWGVHVGQEGRVEAELDDVELVVRAVEGEGAFGEAAFENQ
jgi:hypothetical protein